MKTVVELAEEKYPSGGSNPCMGGHRDAFIAGWNKREEQTAALQARVLELEREVGMRWVKAIDRLPNKKVICRWQIGVHTMLATEGDEFLQRMVKLYNPEIEWLDDSTNSRIAELEHEVKIADDHAKEQANAASELFERVKQLEAEVEEYSLNLKNCTDINLSLLNRSQKSEQHAEKLMGLLERAVRMWNYPNQSSDKFWQSYCIEHSLKPTDNGTR